MRRQIHRVQAWLVRVAFALLRRTLPAAGICVYGSPDTEENGLVAAAELAARCREDVVLLARDPAAARRYLRLVGGHGAHAPDAQDPDARDPAVRVLARDSLAGVLAAARARVLLLTHGLFGSPPARGRLLVNLWHGTGPKRTESAAGREILRADVHVCSSRPWGEVTAASLGAGDAVVAVIGNPRERMLRAPAPDEVLTALGLDPARPIVLWLPTYRATNEHGAVWRDSAGLGDRPGQIAGMARLASEAGVQLVAKPHPRDAETFRLPGLRILETDAIWAAGASLYQLIGRADGMISDYSSVWVEYLSLDRPLLLFCPDIDEYDGGRGFNRPPMSEVAAGLVIRGVEDCRTFFRALGECGDWRSEQRHQVRTRLEMPESADVGGALVDVVSRALTGKGLAPLRPR